MTIEMEFKLVPMREGGRGREPHRLELVHSDHEHHSDKLTNRQRWQKLKLQYLLRQCLA